ncbi:MAG: bifunctional 4-hydroxy-2-oxoglutarate aldolase/2-dehydro-3-deoxy-phosphogluconate aldolase [Clostridia bacterium]|nr:bifunctional 4-hydroxy-2-oxoglutarate aldolase/2-dehydro-3-deoxy-phosphogluconate aldolase [Clostridia bacterium]
MSAFEFIKKHRFIVIFRHIPKEYAKAAARACFDGGVRIFEITFNPSSETTKEDTVGIIRAVKDELGDEISVGAGTVINLDYAKAAYEAGAEFIVSPCTKEDVIGYSKEKGMLSIPGAYTPTEIVNAYDMGADIVKVFPVLPSEVPYLKNVMSPLSHIPFIPTGGINPDTVEEFMDTGAIAVAAGASVVTKALVEAGDFKTVTENAKRHTALLLKA